jgi:thiol-disulfide isomerase/thioredoxin
MSERPEAPAKPKGRLLTWAITGAALVGVAGAVYIIAQSSTKTAPVVATVPVPKTAFAEKLSRPAKPTPAPDYAFNDPAGKPVKIADFKGKVVVLNAWATWCAPCKAEMPTLAKMAQAYKGKPVEFVVVSIDEPEKAAQAALFIAQNDPLKFYHDPAMKLLFRLNGQGAPTTVIYGKDGLEQVRVSGDADWTSPQARALVDKALAGG